VGITQAKVHHNHQYLKLLMNYVSGVRKTPVIFGTNEFVSKETWLKCLGHDEVLMENNVILN